VLLHDAHTEARRVQARLTVVAARVRLDNT
jgi:hypothetical protein